MQLRQKRIVCILFPEPTSFASSLAEACYHFTPQIALRGNEAVFLDLTASWHLFEGKSVSKRLHALCRRFELSPRISLAQDAPTALALARYGQTNQKADRVKLPLEALYDYADPFLITAGSSRQEILQRKISQWISLFRSLGVLDLSDFLALPEKSLAARFGMESLELSRRIRRNQETAWPGFRPPEFITERAELFDAQDMGPCASLDALLHVLKDLIPRALSRLRGKGHKASTIEIEMELDDHSRMKWQLQMPVAQSTLSGMLPLIRDRLAHQLGRKPLAAPALWIDFSILESVPAGAAQKEFFSARENQVEDQAEAWESLLGRLTQKLGKDKAFTAQLVDRHLPEKAWCPVAIANSRLGLGANSSLPKEVARLSPAIEADRPSRMLREPRPLIKEGDLLVEPENALIRTRKALRQWHTLHWEGPERILPEWWESSSSTGGSGGAGLNSGNAPRDYYQVQTAEQEALWVFTTDIADAHDTREVRGVHAGRYFLHGFFD